MMRSRSARAVTIVALLLAGNAAWAQGGAPATIEKQALRGGLQVLRGAGCNVVVWSGPDALLVVDSGTAASAPQLVEATGRPAAGAARFVVNTHWHPDHTGGNELLARPGAVIVAHDNVRVRLATPQNLPAYETRVPASPRSALPVVTFDDTLTLHLNGDRLTLLHVPSAHSDGDVLAWWEDANVVHLGDVYYADAYPFVDVAGGGSLAGLVAAIETVLSRADAETVVVPGHGPVGGRADLAAYRDMLVTVGTRVRTLVEQGRSADEVVAARPTAALDERYGKGGVSADRFVRMLYEDLATRR
jgi:glyoxylase-like metal-dependent hydrolase (beta-lactamase superfamily II)